MTAVRPLPRSPEPLDWLDAIDDIALFLDLDGTVIDLASTPNGVRVVDGLPDLLETLSEVLGGAFAILTGRSIADVDRLLAPTTFVAAGSHGAEYRTHREEIVRPVAPPLERDLTARLEEIAARHPGVWVEDKGVTASIHWRAAPDQAASLETELERLLEDGRDHLEMRPGRRLFEIVPRHVSKGVALEILGGLESFAGRRPVMIGDDHGDESAFLAAERAGGVGFRVAGETFPAEVADFASPAEVRAWLAALAERAARRA